MNPRIGSTSISAVSRFAWVWNRKDPSPITTSKADKTRPTGIPSVRRHITQPASRKAAFVTAFTGSAQYSGPVRSQ